MKLIPTDIKDVVIIEPDVFSDSRGYFFESFSQRRFETLLGRSIDFVQDNESRSKEGVVRGLHYQRAPHAQSKLVRVTQGAILDIAVDIRYNSPTYGKYIAVELSAENHRQLFIPRGFAHGFVVLRGDAVVQYKCDDYYAPECEGTILWNDPQIAVDWQIDPTKKVIGSQRDSEGKRFDPTEEIFDYNTDYYA